MQNLGIEMSGTGTATTKVQADSIDRDEIVSFRLIPPLPYKPTLIPEEKLREIMIQIGREREERQRQAAVHDQSTGLH